MDFYELKMYVISCGEMIFRSSQGSASTQTGYITQFSNHSLNSELNDRAEHQHQREFSFFFNLCILISRSSDETSCLCRFWMREIVYHLSFFHEKRTATSEKLSEAWTNPRAFIATRWILSVSAEPNERDLIPSRQRRHERQRAKQIFQISQTSLMKVTKW